MLELLVIVWLIIIVQMLAAWAFYRVLKNPTVVDVAWALGLTLAGSIYLFAGNINTRALMIFLLLLFWGVRLGGFLWHTRVKQGKVDKRYQKLSENWKISKSVGFLLNFQLQGIFIMLISLPFLLISQQPARNLDFIDAVAVLIVLFAVLLESIADAELYRFQQEKKAGVCDRGLLRYSRHPNYFFEWCVWLGFSLFALKSVLGLLALISPVVLYIIMVKITGPMTEQGSLESRGEAYRKYQESTPMFFPKFKR